MNKKGISTIVATILIILITVSAVTILWTAIATLIDQNLASTACLNVQSFVKVDNDYRYTNFDYLGDCAGGSAPGSNVWRSECIGNGGTPSDYTGANAQTKLYIRIDRDANTDLLSSINIIIDHNGETLTNKTIPYGTYELPTKNGKKVYEIDHAGYLDGKIEAKVSASITDNGEIVDCAASSVPVELKARPSS